MGYDPAHSSLGLEFSDDRSAVQARGLHPSGYKVTTSANVCAAALNPQWTIRIDSYSQCYAAFAVAEDSYKDTARDNTHPFFGGACVPVIGVSSEEKHRTWAIFHFG